MGLNWGAGLGGLGRALMAYGVYQGNLKDRQKGRDDAATRQAERDAQWARRQQEQRDWYDSREEGRIARADQMLAENLIPPSQPGSQFQINPTGISQPIGTLQNLAAQLYKYRQTRPEDPSLPFDQTDPVLLREQWRRSNPLPEDPSLPFDQTDPVLLREQWRNENTQEPGLSLTDQKKIDDLAWNSDPGVAGMLSSAGVWNDYINNLNQSVSSGETVASAVPNTPESQIRQIAGASPDYRVVWDKAQKREVLQRRRRRASWPDTWDEVVSPEMIRELLDFAGGANRGRRDAAQIEEVPVDF